MVQGGWTENEPAEYRSVSDMQAAPSSEIERTNNGRPGNETRHGRLETQF